MALNGCKPLADEEIAKISKYFDSVIGDEERDKHDTWSRNKAIFFFALYSGMRISELLSFTIGDIAPHGKIVNSTYLQKRNTKGKISGRTIPINNQCQQLLEKYFNHYGLFGRPLNTALFESRNGGKISVRQCQNFYKIMFEQSGVIGSSHQLGTHATRKTFATRVYYTTDKDIMATSKALGHKSLMSTHCYILPNIIGLNKALDGLDFTTTGPL